MGPERREGTILCVGGFNQIPGRADIDLEHSTGINAESEELVRSGLESEVSHFGHGVDLSMSWLSHL